MSKQYDDTFILEDDNLIHTFHSEDATLKGFDRGLTLINQKYTNYNGKTKNKKMSIYSTGQCGSNIRNASSGMWYRELVGSAEEALFFKVAYAKGNLNCKNGSNMLFYESPAEYEAHFNLELSQDIKNKWTERTMKKKFEISQKEQAVTGNIDISSTKLLVRQ